MVNDFYLSGKGGTVGAAIRDSILGRVMKHGSFIISDISEDTGYSQTTVSKYVAELLKDGRITEIERISLHTKGRRTVRYGIAPDTYYFAGVDMRSFELSIGIIDFTGKPVRIWRDRSFRLRNTHDILDRVCEQICGFIDTLEGIDRKRIVAININIPGRINSNTGTSATTFNFEETSDVPLTDILSERLGMKVFIEHDTKAMAYGEYMSGASRKYSNMLYVNIGWGLGLGIIIDGRLYYGKDGYSGEIGHVHSYDNNILCHCGKKGCVETEISMRAIHRKLVERIRHGETSILSAKVRDGEEITPEDITGAVEKEDALCIELVSQTGSMLGEFIAGLINIFNPEAIVIGGNLASVEACYFLQPIETAIRKYALRLMCQNVPVMTSSTGSEAAVLGACLIARGKCFGKL